MGLIWILGFWWFFVPITPQKALYKYASNLDYKMSKNWTTTLWCIQQDQKYGARSRCNHSYLLYEQIHQQNLKFDQFLMCTVMLAGIDIIHLFQGTFLNDPNFYWSYKWKQKQKQKRTTFFTLIANYIDRFKYIHYQFSTYLTYLLSPNPINWPQLNMIIILHTT